jgi:protein required for attachment to host cells
MLVIVADGGAARFYRPERSDGPRAGTKLVELETLQHPDSLAASSSLTGRPATETNTNRQAGPVHPIGAQRERHRLEHDHSFAHEIERRAVSAARDWKAGTVVLVAEPRMLGLVREPLRGALRKEIALKELAKDYTRLGAAELLERLEKNGVITPLRLTQ